MQEKNYFYLAGFISVSIYVTICILLLYYLNSPKTKKFDAFSKTTVLELELISLKSNKNKVAEKSIVKKQEIIQKSTSKSHKAKADFKSLFANVRIKAKIISKKNINTIIASIDTSRFKSKFQKQKKTDNISISKLLTSIKTSSEIPVNAGGKGEKHKYFSKIKEILWIRWNPRLLEEGLSVKVLVKITKDGKFDYRIMKYSNDIRFDESLKEFLNAQINEMFPTHNIKNKVDIIINFKSEG